MNSDLVAELEILGISCNSSKSNMATPVKKQIITGELGSKCSSMNDDSAVLQDA